MVPLGSWTDSNNKLSVSSVKGWAKNGGGYCAEEDRAQRHTLALRDVAYVIKADVVLRPHADADVAKYRDIFRRRVQKGQYHHTPYLGCREFSAHFSPVDEAESPIPWSDDLGRMLFDVRYDQDSSGRGQPIFFHALIEDGIMKIPQSLYERRDR
ncbi:CRISPR-associated protein Cas5d [Heliophilum fasciatum]|nr:CRISPR-associated protein Cas5d [Heliophilum fasciatum]